MPKIQLSEIAELNANSISTKSIPALVEYLDTGNITKNIISKIQAIDTLKDKLPNRAQRRVKDKTIIYSTVRPNLEHYGFMDRPSSNLVVSTGFTTIDIVDDNYNPKYIYYLLTMPQRTDYLHTLAQSGVSAYPSINPSDLGDMVFDVPDRPTQDKVVFVLEALDAKISINSKVNSGLEALARDLYSYWFVQFEFPDDNQRPYKTAGGAMVYNAELKRKIPATWSVGGLNQFIANEKTGDWGKESTQANYTRQVTCIRGTDLNSILKVQELNAPVRYILEKNTHKLLQKNDIVIEISGGSPTQSTGRAAYITDEVMSMFDNPLICSNFCKAVSVKKDLHLFFVYYLWQHLYDNDVFFGYEGKTSGIKNLLYENFINSYKVVLPDEEILTKFNDAIRPLSLAIVANRKEAMRLLSARDWLLPMLMNGQLKVID
jgi:type I restriction enzyme S subunit